MHVFKNKKYVCIYNHACICVQIFNNVLMLFSGFLPFHSMDDHVVEVDQHPFDG